MSNEDAVAKCEGCYLSFSGWWCDNCDQWPCVCGDEQEDGPELAWHYGPTATDPDRGKMWHTGCGQEVLSIDGGLICGCGQQQEGS